MGLTSFFGFCAAFCTTGALLPQAIKIFKSQETAQISFLMLLMQCVGNVLWAVYGYRLGSTSLILANVLAAIFAAFMLSYKIRHMQRKS